MKFFVAFVVLVAVAAANPIKPVNNDLAQLEAIVAAIHSPSTDPATAALLEDQLQAIIAELSPISVGPAIVEQSPVSVGPAIVDFPLPDGGAVTAVEPTPVVSPSPVVIGDIPAGASPLVQIIVNVNQPESVVPAPVEAGVVEEVHTPGPVNVVDNVIYPDVVLEPVQVVEPVIVDPVQVAEPIFIEPVQVGVPIIPAPAVVLPDELN